MKKHIGVVLRTFSSDRKKHSILDRHEGKVTRISYDTTITQGALISYFVKVTVCSQVITGERVLDLPLELARDDILFLHHILELCNYFLREQGPVRTTFDLLMLLYTPGKLFSSVVKKKFFLFKLLLSFGCYTDYEPFSLSMFHRLRSESIDSLANSHLDLEIERDMDEWLCSCVGAHPCFRFFKTVCFLENNRAL